MRGAGRLLPVLVLVATLSLAGCGGSSDDSAPPSDGQSAAAGATRQPGPDDSATESGPDDPPTHDNAVEIEIEIEHGRVTPSGERVDVRVGQPIRLVVDSDAPDEIHVHSTPEHAFRVRPGMDDKEFRFRLTQPGVVEMELHEQGDVIATLAARP
jgi:hypothetical protein